MDPFDRHDASQVRLVWPPAPGFFAMRLVKGGWAVPARILLTDRDEWQVELDGKMCEAHADPTLAQYVATVWQSGTRVDESDWRWRNAMRAHAEANKLTNHPALNPRRPIDHRTLDPIMPRCA